MLWASCHSICPLISELNKDINGWVAYGQCSTDAVTDDSSASATTSHSQSPHLSGSPSPRVSTAAGPSDSHGPACVVRGGDCSSGACCQPLTCHLEGKRCVRKQGWWWQLLCRCKAWAHLQASSEHVTVFVSVLVQVRCVAARGFSVDEAAATQTAVNRG